MVLGGLLCSGPTLLASFIERRRDDDIYERTGWFFQSIRRIALCSYDTDAAVSLCQCTLSQYSLVLACSVRPLHLDAQ